MIDKILSAVVVVLMLGILGLLASANRIKPVCRTLASELHYYDVLTDKILAHMEQEDHIDEELVMRTQDLWVRLMKLDRQCLGLPDPEEETSI